MEIKNYKDSLRDKVYIYRLWLTDFDLGKSTKDESILEYTSDISKKRALTVSKALKIYLKIKILQGHNKNSIEIKEYFKTFSNLAIIENANRDIYEVIKKIDFNNKDLFSTSVTLAWTETFVETGFFPKDTSVLLLDSQTHLALVEEVKHLINVNYSTLAPYFDSMYLNGLEVESIINSKLDSYEVDFLEKTDKQLVYLDFKTGRDIDVEKDTKIPLELKEKSLITDFYIFYLRSGWCIRG